VRFRGRWCCAAFLEAEGHSAAQTDITLSHLAFFAFSLAPHFLLPPSPSPPLPFVHIPRAVPIVVPSEPPPTPPDDFATASASHHGLVPSSPGTTSPDEEAELASIPLDASGPAGASAADLSTIDEGSELRSSIASSGSASAAVRRPTSGIAAHRPRSAGSATLRRVGSAGGMRTTPGMQDAETLTTPTSASPGGPNEGAAGPWEEAKGHTAIGALHGRGGGSGAGDDDAVMTGAAEEEAAALAAVALEAAAGGSGGRDQGRTPEGGPPHARDGEAATEGRSAPSTSRHSTLPTIYALILQHAPSVLTRSVPYDGSLASAVAIASGHTPRRPRPPSASRRRPRSGVTPPPPPAAASTIGASTANIGNLDTMNEGMETTPENVEAVGASDIHAVPGTAPATRGQPYPSPPTHGEVLGSPFGVEGKPEVEVRGATSFALLL